MINEMIMIKHFYIINLFIYLYQIRVQLKNQIIDYLDTQSVSQTID